MTASNDVDPDILISEHQYWRVEGILSLIMVVYGARIFTPSLLSSNCGAVMEGCVTVGSESEVPGGEAIQDDDSTND
jgi:hypothetical protein